MADSESQAAERSARAGKPRARGDGASPAEDRQRRMAAALRLGLPGKSREAASRSSTGEQNPDAGRAGRNSGGDDASQLPLYNRLTAFETVLVAGGVVLFLLLLYGMWGFLNPPLLAVAGTLLLWPLREHKTVRALMVSGGFLLLLWLMADLSTVLIPFAVVYILAYLFDPFVTHLQEHFGVSRRFSSLLISTLVTGVFALFVVLLVPRLAGQVEVLVERVMTSVGDVRTWIETASFFNNLEATGLISRQQLIDQINQLLQAQSGRIASGLPAIVEALAASLDSFLGAIAIIAIMPAILFYTLKDYPFITPRLMELFPTFGGERDYLVNASRIVGNYLRGQLLVCAIAGFNVSLFLSPLIFDVPLWLLLGLVAGIANLIPNLGAILSMIIAVAVTLILGDPVFDTLAVVAVLMGQGFLEQSVLTPNIMSHQVGLHPVLVMLSLFVFGYFMGAFGLLIAVPATALMMTIYKTYRQDLTLDLSSYGVPASDPQAQRHEQ